MVRFLWVCNKDTGASAPKQLITRLAMREWDPFRIMRPETQEIGDPRSCIEDLWLSISLLLLKM